VAGDLDRQMEDCSSVTPAAEFRNDGVSDMPAHTLKNGLSEWRIETRPTIRCPTNANRNVEGMWLGARVNPRSGSARTSR